MRKPDKTPTPVEPDEKSVKQEELGELSFSFLSDRKWRRNLIRKPDIQVRRLSKQEERWQKYDPL